MAASKTPNPPPGKPNDPRDSESQIPGAGGAGPAGRVVHDERGNAVWKWGGDAARSDSTSKVLRQLQVPELEIEGQEEPARRPDKGQATTTGQPATKQHNAAPKGQVRAPMVDAGGGYNPYNLSVPVKKQSAPKSLPTKGSGPRSR